MHSFATYCFSYAKLQDVNLLQSYFPVSSSKAMPKDLVCYFSTDNQFDAQAAESPTIG